MEQQEKLRLQQQIQEHQKQIMLQQQIHRQNHSVVQTISSVPNTVPIVKSSPTPVISHQNPHGTRPEATANTIIVLNDEYLSPSASEALKCIQASDGSYHVIGNMELGERQSSNTTSVIAHTSPTTITVSPMQNQTSARKKRGGGGNGRGVTATASTVAKQNNTTITYTQAAVSGNKRKRATQTITTLDAPIHLDTHHVQTIETVTEVPQQQFYIAYNDNGVLVPIDAPSTSTAILGEHTTQETVEVVNLSNDQYIIEDLDASRKAQQKNRKPLKRQNHSQVRIETFSFGTRFLVGDSWRF